MSSGMTTDASEIAREFKGAYMAARNLRELKATVAWSNMANLTVTAHMDVTAYKGETYKYPKDWSPHFWKWLQVAAESGVVPDWAKKIVNCLVEGETSKDRSMRGRQNIAVAFCNAVEDQLELLKSYVPSGTNISRAYATCAPTTLTDLPRGAKLKPAEFAHLVRDPKARPPISGDLVIPCGPYYIQRRENRRFQWEVEQTCKSMNDFCVAFYNAAQHCANTATEICNHLNNVLEPTRTVKERVEDTIRYRALMSDEIAWMNEAWTLMPKIEELATHAADVALRMHNIPPETDVVPDSIEEDEDVVPCMESPSAHLTSQPPVTGEGGGMSSATAGTTNVGITGIADNPLEGAAATNVVSAMPTSGTATAPTTMMLAGGVGPELMAQTGFGESIATLIGKKVFKRIVPVNTGITQGTVLFKKKIDPWDPELLNTATYEWAKLHKRFYGRMRMHIQFITASTVIGAVKFYYVPKLLEDVVISQEALDNLGTFVELSLASAGEAVLEMNPTIGATAVTGIMRGEGPWGMVVGIASTDIANAYSNATSVQVKLSFSLAENSVYDIPSFLTDASAIGNAQYDIGFGATDKVVVDGNHYPPYAAPGNDWTNEYGYKIANPLAMGGYPMFYNGPNQTNLYLCSGRRPLYIAAGRNGPFDADYTHGFSDHIGGTTTGVTRVSTSGYYAAYTAMAADFADAKEIIYWNYGAATKQLIGDCALAVVTGGTKLYTAIVAATAAVRLLTPTSISDNLVAFKHHDKMTMSTGRGVCAAYTRLVKMNCSTSEAFSSTYCEEPEQVGFRSTLNVSGMVCTGGYTAKGALPNGYYRVTISDNASYIPTVSSTVAGVSVPCTYSEHGDNANVSDITSYGETIVTELRTASGALVGEILRNSHGMFCYMRDTTRKYSAMTENIRALKQIHRITDTEWPQLKEFNKDFLTSRLVTTFEDAVALNCNEPEYSRYTLREQLSFDDIGVAIARSSKKGVSYAENPTAATDDPIVPCIAPAVALGFTMLGKGGMETFTSLTNSFYAAPNIKRVEAQGNAMVTRVKGEQDRMTAAAKAHQDRLTALTFANVHLAQNNGGVWTYDPVHGTSLS